MGRAKVQNWRRSPLECILPFTRLFVYPVASPHPKLACEFVKGLPDPSYSNVCRLLTVIGAHCDKPDEYLFNHVFVSLHRDSVSDKS